MAWFSTPSYPIYIMQEFWTINAQANIKVIFKEKQKVLKEEYPSFILDFDEVLINRDKIESLKKSRIIKCLIKLGFLNKF